MKENHKEKHYSNKGGHFERSKHQKKIKGLKKFFGKNFEVRSSENVFILMTQKLTSNLTSTDNSSMHSVRRGLF